MQRHPDRDGAAGLAEVPLQRRLDAGDEGQPARPERLDQVPGGAARARSRCRRGCAAYPTSTGTGMSPAAALGREQPGDGLRRERVGAQAVDRVGRQHDELAAAYRVAGQVEPDRPLARRTAMSYRRIQPISRPSPLQPPSWHRSGPR